MSSEFQVPHGPPWGVDVVADVHAGVYPAELTTELMRSISADPEGAAILAALDSTVDDLSLLPPLVMPERYALRMDAVLADLAMSMSAAPSRSGTSRSTRAGIGALLQAGPGGPGSSTAPPGLPRPQNGPPGRLPRQSVIGAGPRPMVPPRHGPVIPRVLPGGPHRTGPGGPPHTVPASEEPTRLTAVSDLQAAHDRADRRPAAPAAGPSGPSGTPPRIGSLEAQRAKRRRWTGGLLAAAAVVAIGGVTALALNRTSEPTASLAVPDSSAAVTVPTQLPSESAVGEPGPSALVLEPGRFGDQLDEIEGKAPAGATALTNPATYASCLAANDISGAGVTGVTEATYRGQDAYAIAVDVSATTVRIVVVGTQCGQNGNADTLDSQTVTR